MPRSHNLEIQNSLDHMSRQRRIIVAGSTVLALLGIGGAVGAVSGGGNAHKSERPTPTTLDVPTSTSLITTTTTQPEVTTTTEHLNQDEIESWPIVGSPEFQTDIRASLRRIKSQPDQTYWKVVKKYGGAFQEEDVNYGVFPYEHKIKVNDQERKYITAPETGDPAVDAANKKRNEDWLDSSIIHESLQGDFFIDGQPWQGYMAENRALWVQQQYLKYVKADSSQVNFVGNEIDPTDSPASYWNRYEDEQIKPFKPS